MNRPSNRNQLYCNQLHTSFMAETLSIGTILTWSWEKTKQHLGFLILIFIIEGFLFSIPEFAAYAVREKSVWLYQLISLLGSIVNIWLGAGVIFIGLKIFSEQIPKVSDLFSQYKILFNLCLASILYGLWIMLGFLLLIVPGIIWAIKYQFTNYLIVEKGLGPIEALRASAALTKGKKGEIFLLNLSLLGIIVASMIPLGFGLLVSVPLTWMSMVKTYKTLDAAQ